MKCCEMHAGLLTERVTIERLTVASDGYGGSTRKWVADPRGGVPASLRPLSGTEALRAQRISPSATYRLYIRFRADANGNPYYTPADRVMFQGRAFDILNLFDLEMQHRWIEMLLNEGKLS